MADYGPHNPIRVYTETIDLASVAANTSAEQDITVTGVTTSDVILNVIKPTAEAGIGIVGARIKAADTVALTIMNATASAVNAASQAGWQFVVLKA